MDGISLGVFGSGSFLKSILYARQSNFLWHFCKIWNWLSLRKPKPLWASKKCFRVLMINKLVKVSDDVANIEKSLLNRKFNIKITNVQ